MLGFGHVARAVDARRAEASTRSLIPDYSVGLTYQGNLNASFQSSPTFVRSISKSADPVKITKYFLNTGSIVSSASWI